MNQLSSNEPHTSPFDAIRREDENGGEYWSARELYKLLGYSRWEKFQQSLEEAKVACEQSRQTISDHFHLEVKMIKAGKGAKRPIEDYHLYQKIRNASSSALCSPLLMSDFKKQHSKQE